MWIKNAVNCVKRRPMIQITAERKISPYTEQLKWPSNRLTYSFTEANYANSFGIMTTRLLRKSINRVVFTWINKRNSNMSTQHGSRLSCSVYAFMHVDLCTHYVDTFIFPSVHICSILYRWDILDFGCLLISFYGKLQDTTRVTPSIPIVRA